ncbi:uncharacterized protein LOC117645886 [Thrips palmi]|uniref:Uncharacterized protein LOC117645886 n=1 Tax=Thrips palmi TaxID=161013 RepID=A0A6P8YQP7_THRPL|nr:uncharacterized protein LOC117645886 [Thrips palmi]
MYSTLAIVAVLATAALAAPGTPFSHTPELPGQVDNALLQAELRAWKAAGKPDSVHFPDANARPVLADVVGNHSAHGLRGFFWFPTADDIKFHLYTKQDDTDIHGQEVFLSPESLLEAGFDTSLPTKVVIHGFTNNIESPVIQDIKNGEGMRAKTVSGFPRNPLQIAFAAIGTVRLAGPGARLCKLCLRTEQCTQYTLTVKTQQGSLRYEENEGIVKSEIRNASYYESKPFLT